MVKVALIVLTFVYFLSMGWAVHILDSATTSASKSKSSSIASD